MARVGDVLKSLDADIVNLVEVEDCTVLARMARDYARTSSGNYSSYLVKGMDSSTGQNVGMLTRISPLDNLQRTEERANYPVRSSQCRFFGSLRDTSVTKVSFVTVARRGQSGK